MKEKIQQLLSRIISKPANPKMPRPIFVIFLVVAIIAVGFSQLARTPEEPPTGEVPAEESPSITERLSEFFENIVNRGRPEDLVVELPTLPQVAPPKPLDEALLSEVERLKAEQDQDWKILEPRVSVGRVDPMRPVAIGGGADSLGLYILYVSTSKSTEFFPVGGLPQREQDKLTRIPVSGKISPPATLLEFRTWEEAIASGREASSSANEFRKALEENSVEKALILGSPVLAPREIRTHNTGLFAGMTAETISLRRISVTADNFVVGEFHASGSVFTNIREGDYLGGIFFVREYNLVDRTVTLERDHRRYIIKESPRVP